MFLTPAYSVGVFFFAANHTANIQNYFLLRVFLYDFPFLPQDCIEYFVGADWFSGGDVYCVEV